MDVTRQSLSSSGLRLPRSNPKRARWSWLLGGLIFLCGTIAGAGVTVVVLTQTFLHVIQHPEEIPERLARRLRRALDLSDEQMANVREILTRHQETLWDIRRQVRPRVEEVLDRIQIEVASVLTEQQAQQWHRRVSRLRRRWVRLLPQAPQSDDPRWDRDQHTEVRNGGE